MNIILLVAVECLIDRFSLPHLLKCFLSITFELLLTVQLVLKDGSLRSEKKKRGFKCGGDVDVRNRVSQVRD